MTIAQILRAKSLAARKTVQNADSNRLSSIDEQIASLENKSDDQYNNNDSDSSSNEESASDNETNSQHNTDYNGVAAVTDRNGNVIKLSTQLSDDDYIPSLPIKQLPAKRCHFANGPSSNKKRKISFQDERGSNSDSKPVSSMHTFMRTVKEVVDSYVPASHEKKPFYCRICRFQATDLPSFEQHRQSAEHETAAQTEKKVCFCKLCRKKFTSPHQLTEHLTGKAHKERLEQVRQGQQQNRNDNRQFV